MSKNGDPIKQASSEIESLSKALEKARTDNLNLRSLNRKLIKNTGMTFESSVEEFKRFFQEEEATVFKASFTTPPPAKTLSKPAFDKNHSEIVGLLFSDLHVGETVNPMEINFMNSYDPVILSNRLWDLTSSVIEIVRAHQTMYDIQKLWIPILGDMISGSIHPELVLTNALLDYPSSVLAARLVISVVNRLKTLGIPIELDCLVGNHARSLPKLTTKKQAHLSLDWMVYIMVEEYFRQDTQVSVTVHQSQFAIVQQFGHRFVMEHGAGVSNAKIDQLDSKLRNMFDNATYRAASGLEGSSVDFVLLGDKHRAQRHPNALVNGCLVGASEITTSWRLSPIKAEQILFGISRKRPITWDYFIDLTDNVSREGNNPFSRYTLDFMSQHGR